jgi:hypothetical protein
MEQKGFGTQVIVAIVVIVAIAGGIGGYFVVTGTAPKSGGDTPICETENQPKLELVRFDWTEGWQHFAGDIGEYPVGTSLNFRVYENYYPIGGKTLVENGVTTTVFLDPSEGATIEVNGVEKTYHPSEDVTFSFDEPGTFSIRVEKEGFEGATYTITIRPQEGGASTPATFELSNLVVNPTEVEVGENVEISVTIKNVGGSEGTYYGFGALKVDNSPYTLAQEGVTLEGGENTTLATALSDVGLTAGPKTYSVEVENLTGSFEVVNPAGLEVTALSVSPWNAHDPVEPYDRIQIKATVKNNNTAEGTYWLNIKINGQTDKTYALTVPGDNTLTYLYEKRFENAGTYTISVNGLDNSVTVVDAGKTWHKFASSSGVGDKFTAPFDVPVSDPHLAWRWTWRITPDSDVTTQGEPCYVLILCYPEGETIDSVSSSSSGYGVSGGVSYPSKTTSTIYVNRVPGSYEWSGTEYVFNPERLYFDVTAVGLDQWNIEVEAYY